MILGDFALHSLCDGFFEWADDRHCTRLALRPLLVVSGPNRLLIDCGIGDICAPGTADTCRAVKFDTIDASLGRAGFSPADVTHVILTHLHFDHCGGSTRLESGRVVPRFPNARHFVQLAEWERATSTDRRARAAYCPDSFLPLEAVGLLEAVEGDFEPVPGVTVKLAPSHTPGFQLVFIRSGGATALYWSDLLPTKAHIATPYIVGYDVLPLQTMELKEQLVGQAFAEQWLCFPAHDTEMAVGTLERDGSRWTLRGVRSASS